VALSNLGSLSLWASLKFIAAILITLIRTSGSSEMHSEAVIPRMGGGGILAVPCIVGCLLLTQPSQRHWGEGAG
jgi:UDP-N-acetylmuramyl pentapeptide phosphotransferase/UDP-N-acetylglucosamine-1-phosphate transferase